MRKSMSTLAVLGLGLATVGFGTAAPAAAAPAPATPAPVAAPHAGYVAKSAESDASKAFFQAVLESVAEKRAASPSATAAVTVVYDASRAPTFSSQIARSTQIWNGAVSNVKLQSGSASSADFSYREGNDSRGSYASTDGHGNGYIFLDYRQNQQYNSTRVTAHETGHVLGLPDHYSGPCSELMSGGGPGTSCTNANPNAAERARVNQLWANGLAAAMDKALDKALEKSGR
ncbi:MULTISPECIES: snapalysin [Streptomyces]|uniref:Extracellular small neutral protease n=1 Tax=Streptomyces koelreuteriae TaxID=2838015 RepID=A0ABX8FTI4_9ACTN|nr:MULTISPECIES: snapalysin [Streptomyces]QWB24361.1 snapalysin [Streptomyces koelreuteriae]UUA07364.1 snapalysin [Streptomyces koelreuteriae]UUA14994.1 snapalysin [Streptomyces sp. CRCS-T-1]